MTTFLRKGLLITWFSLFLVHLYASDIEVSPLKDRGSDPFFPVHYGKKWGFISAQGKLVIPPKFDSVESFFQGLACAVIRRNEETKYGFIDTKGDFVIEPVYDNAGNFSEGLAPVLLNRKWGFIDREGKYVIPPSYQGAGEFHEGLACIQIWHKMGTGPGGPNITADNVPTEYLLLLKNLIHFQQRIWELYPDGKFGYIDKAGKMVIQPQDWDLVEPFHDGLAVVRKMKKGWSFINHQGNLVVNKWFDYCRHFSEGMAVVWIGSLYGYIDIHGKLIIPPKYEMAGDFSEGIAPVKTKDQKWGGIDKKGQFVIRPIYDDLYCFSDGLAIAELDGKRQFIDRTGKLVRITALPIQWYGFSGGMAIVGERGKRVYINGKGHMVAPYETETCPN